MRFNFVGKVGFNSETSKVPPFKKIEGYDAYSLNLICIAANNNRAFCEMSGFKGPVKGFDNNGNKIEISWDDRFKDEIVKNVRTKSVISLGGERHEFISPYDFILFVKDNADKIKDKRFIITGNVRKNEYKGKITDRFNIQSMYELDEDDTRANALRVSGEFFFNKDSVDTSEFDSDRKIYLNGYTKENIGEHKGVYVAKQIVIDCSKINFEDENHVARLNYQLKQIGLVLDSNNKVVSKLKKKYRCINANCSYQNGTEEIEFGMDQLTPNQKTAVELGLNKIEDFRPTNAIYGERKVIYRFKSWDLRGDYADGSIDAADDVDELIYVPIENVEVADFDKSMNKPEPKKESAPKAEDDFDDDLFGD